MKVCVVGLGYVGLPTAALAACAGHIVFGYDTDPNLRDALRRGHVRGHEQDVADAVRTALRNGTLHVCARLEPADVYVVCVPTPSVGNRPDLRYVEAALTQIAEIARPKDLIILESTVPPGTTERLVRQALRTAEKSFLTPRIVHAPERILPGDIVRELRENDRIIGARTPEDAAAAKAFYSSFVTGRLHVTDIRTAEFVKVIENTYRDVNIALANELALFCEEIDIDVWQAITLANNHPRVNLMRPGPGVGGHCIPIDPRFLADQNPFATELIQASRRVNERMPSFVVRRIERLIGEADGGTKIAILGASYKANVDDTRESPALRIAEMLAERGYHVAIYDPVARPSKAARTLDEAVAGSDAVLLAVAHDAFRTVDPLHVAALMRERVLVDCHNFFEADAWEAVGFSVYTLGRGAQVTERPLLARAQSVLA
ncbi:MAG TPA: nucleotide sugar dehydrogenase [Candidatus Cybelea sp.]|nr:nucleotide sugar dehydrogenase [Candidatus Cybelea sp.]